MARRGTRIGAGALLAAVLVMSALAASASAATTKTVTLTVANVFEPGSVSVAVGDTVSFKWGGGFHDVTFSDGTASGAPTAEETTTWSRSFSSAGTYAYVCSVHEANGMKGTITVQAAASGATTSGSSAEASLPLTGPEDTILPILGLTMLTAAAASLMMARRRREH